MKKSFPSVWLSAALTASAGCDTPGAASCVTLVLRGSVDVEHSFQIPASWLYRSEVVEGVRKSIVIDLPYKILASQQVKLRSESEWKHSSDLMVTLDVRPWVHSPQEVRDKRIKDDRFARGSVRRVYSMTEYVAVDMGGDRRETVYYPDDLAQGVWEINCSGGGDPYLLVGCTVFGEYRPGIWMRVTMPAGHLSEYRAFWDRTKEVLGLLESEGLQCR